VYDAQVVDGHDVRVHLLLNQYLDGHPRDERQATMIAGHQVPDDFSQHRQPVSMMSTAELQKHERMAVQTVGLDQAVRVEHLGHSVNGGDGQLCVQRIADDDQIVAVRQRF